MWDRSFNSISNIVPKIHLLCPLVVGCPHLQFLHPFNNNYNV